LGKHGSGERKPINQVGASVFYEIGAPRSPLLGRVRGEGKLATGQANEKKARAIAGRVGQHAATDSSRTSSFSIVHGPV